MDQREITQDEIDQVLNHGIAFVTTDGIQRKYEGMVVVTSLDSKTVLTAYRTSKVDEHNKRKVYSTKDQAKIEKSQHKSLRNKRKYKMYKKSR